MSSDKREYPERPIASVGACVFKDGRILLARRANAPSEGLWSVPGGKIELGETIQDAAKRELREECGIEIEPGRIFNVENLIIPDEKGLILYHYTVIYLVAEYSKGEISAGSDALDVRWAESTELKSLDMNPVVRRNMLEAFRIRSQ